MKMLVMLALKALALAFIACAAYADTVTFASLPGATLNHVLPVKATAIITTGDGDVAIALNNLIDLTPAQCLTGLFFMVNAPVDVPLGSTVTGSGMTWDLESFGFEGSTVHVLHLSSADNAIAQSAAFRFGVTGITASTNVPFATFSFGPDGVNVQGVNLAGAPEPATWEMMALAMMAFIALSTALKSRLRPCTPASRN